MRMAFEKFKTFPGKALKFIADGYSAYPLAAAQFKEEKGIDVTITQVIGLTNDDAVSTELRDAQDALDVLKKAIGILGKD